LSKFVRDVVLRHPKTMSAQTSVNEASAAKTNDPELLRAASYLRRSVPQPPRRGLTETRTETRTSHSWFQGS
jgi:hypothetical protein